MAIEKMSMINIVGPLTLFDDVARKCADSEEFQPENALKIFDNLKEFIPFSENNPYGLTLKIVTDYLNSAGCSLNYKPFDEVSEDLTAINEITSNCVCEYNSMLAEKEKLEKNISDNSQILIQLNYLKSLSVPIDEFFHFKITKFRYGRMPKDSYEKLLKYADSSQFYHFEVLSDQEYVWCMYFTPEKFEAKTDSLFASLSFVRIRIPDKVHGRPEEAQKEIEAEIVEDSKKLKNLNLKIENFKTENNLKILKYYSKLKYFNDIFEIRKYAAKSEGNFYLAGWVPENISDKFVKNFSKLKGVSCIIESPSETTFKPPTKLKNFFLFSPFEEFVKMYGLPSYNEMDPTPMITIIYTILFGMMFGDVGQGFVISLVGFVLYKWKKAEFGKILITIGLSSFVFGFIYGSVFGSENIIPGLIKPMEKVMVVLIGTIAIGVVIIVFTMVLNIINGIRQKNIEKIFFSPNGLSGIIFYLGIIIGIVVLFGFGKNVFTPLFIAFVIGLPLLFIFLKDPLIRLIKKHKFKPSEGSWGSFILEGFFEMIEVLLSYFKNTISFVRAGAAALNHAGMMLVIMLLIEMTGIVGGTFVFIIGNIFVIALEGLVCGIQTMRLSFYEMFSRFYSGEGESFNPFKINYKNK